MAGGIGSRFWPVSRNARPKQFLDVLGVGRTFLQSTFDRFSKIVPKENIMVVTAEIYHDLVREQLPELAEEHILLEPYRRNTAPCIAYATYKLKKKDPDAVVVVAPSDHLIMDDALFCQTIETAFQLASSQRRLLTLGIQPTRPETGYGYIQASIPEKIDVNGAMAYPVKTFTEKPDEDLAKVFVESGEFLWNSGIFVWSLDSIVAELESKLPEVAASFARGEEFYYGPKEKEFVRNVYEDCQSISIDYGVMEKTDHAWVVKASFGWSDLGTWRSLYMQLDKDERENVVVAHESMLDRTDRCMVYSTEKDKLIVIKGLEGYLVINTDDVMMICPRDRKDFKDLMTDLSLSDKVKYQ